MVTNLYAQEELGRLGRAFEIRVLGPIDLAVDGTSTPITSPIQRTLLALLVVAKGGVVSADRLAEAVWSKGDQSDRRRLWFHMSRLRDALGEGAAIENADGGYRLVVAQSAVDAWVFEDTVATAIGKLDDQPLSSLEQLEGALSVWRGEAFENVAPEAVGWAEPVRLGELRLSALEYVFAIKMNLGRYDEVISALDSIIREHPYREGLRGQLMQALYATGRQREALEVYADTRRAMAEDLGLEPSPRLQELEGQILRQDPELAVAPLGPRADTQEAQPKGRDSFAGRRKILESIGTVVDRVLSGSTEVVLMAGQAGSGKSALTRESIRLAQARDDSMLALEGRGRVTSGPDDPLGAVADVARLLLGDLSSVGALRLTGEDNIRRLSRASHVVADALGNDSGLVGTLVPSGEVHTRLAGTGFELEESPGRSRSSAAEELVRLVVSVARRVPVVVGLDDLHWADQSSIEVVLNLIDQSDGKLLLIATYRPEGVESDTALIGALSTIRSHGCLAVDLDHVALNDSAELIDGLIDREANALDEGFRQELLRVSEGIPLFAVEFLTALEDRGVLARGADGLYLATDPDWELWPVRVEGVLSARFEPLDESLLQLLRIASVEGEEFTAEIVASITGVDILDALDMMSRGAGERHRLVDAAGPAQIGTTRVLRYRFRHHLFQKFLYEQIDESRRAIVHEEVADAFVSMVDEKHDDEHAVTIARHYELAHLPVQAVDWLGIAAKRAIWLAANEDAISLLRRGIELVGTLPASPESSEKEFGLWLQLGTAYAITAGFASTEVKDAFNRASVLADSSQSYLQRMQVFFGLFVYHATVGDFQEARKYEVLTSEVAEASGDAGMRLQALHCAWPSALFRGDLESAIETTSTALDTYRYKTHHPLTFRFGNHDAAVCALSLGGLAKALHGDGLSASRSVRQALELATTFDHMPSVMQARTLQTWIAQLNDEVDLARECAEAALNTGISAPVWANIARSTLAWADVQAGEADRAVDALLDELEVTYFLSRVWYGFTGSLLIEAMLAAGRLEQARSLGERLLADAETIGGFYAPEVFRTVGLLWRHIDDDEAASELLTKALTLARQQKSSIFAGRAAAAVGLHPDPPVSGVT